MTRSRSITFDRSTLHRGFSAGAPFGLARNTRNTIVAVHPMGWAIMAHGWALASGQSKVISLATDVKLHIRLVTPRFALDPIRQLCMSGGLPLTMVTVGSSTASIAGTGG